MALVAMVADMAPVAVVADMTLVAMVADMALVAVVADMALVAVVAEMALVAAVDELVPNVKYDDRYCCSRYKIVVTKYHQIEGLYATCFVATQTARWDAAGQDDEYANLPPANFPQLTAILFRRSRVST